MTDYTTRVRALVSNHNRALALAVCGGRVDAIDALSAHAPIFDDQRSLITCITCPPPSADPEAAATPPDELGVLVHGVRRAIAPCAPWTATVRACSSAQPAQ